MTECVFCRIVSKEAAASFVYEDAHNVAFMDIRPIHRGHLLVVPKKHAKLVKELPEAEYLHLFKAVRRVYQALQDSEVKGEGVTWFVADGPPDQEVEHIHVHLIPRSSGDGFGYRFPPGYGNVAVRPELDTVAARIRDALSA